MLEQIGDWTTQLSVGKRATIYPKRPVFFLPQDGLNMPQLYNPRLDFADQFPLGKQKTKQQSLSKRPGKSLQAVRKHEILHTLVKLGSK